LFDRFVISFNDADILIVAPIFPAGEDAIEGVNAELLVREIKEHGHREVMFCQSEGDILPTLLSVAEPGDLVMTLGAGNINTQGEKFLNKLRLKSNKKAAKRK
jgi:UDP-N-acetylmuramate--alanine ligase